MIFILASIKFLTPFFLQNHTYELHRDEFLYLADGEHLSWGYFEMPPLLALLARLSYMAGAGMFAIKFWPAFFGALTYLLIAKAVMRTGGKYFAVLLAFLSVTFSAFQSTHFLFQPNFLEVFFSTLMCYCIILFIQTKKIIWLYIWGIAFGLGMLSKTSVAFFTISMICGFIISARQNILLNKHFYAALFFGFVIFLPNVIWEYHHHFPVLSHLQELRQTQLINIEPFDFIKGQVLLNFPVLIVWAAGLFFILFNRTGKQYLLFLSGYLVFMLLLILLHGKDYYGLPVYPVLFIFGAVYIENAIVKKQLRAIIVVLILCLGLIDLPMELPIMKPAKLAAFYKQFNYKKFGVLQWEDGTNHPLKQDFSDMLSWKEIAIKTEQAFKNIPVVEKNNTMIYCSNYGICGAINYYRSKSTMPPAYTDNASFLMWMPLQLNIRNVIFAGHTIPEEWQNKFNEIQVIDSLNDSLVRENGLKIILFRGVDSSFNSMFQKKIKSKKQKFALPY